MELSMAESHFRSAFKAVSYRILGTLSTILISYLITEKVDLALEIGLFEFIGKIGIFYIHERLWGMIPFGLSKEKAIDINPQENADVI